MTKMVLKYGTGKAVPEGAVYLSTVTQTKFNGDKFLPGTGWVECWFVWHYFLVEVPVGAEIPAEQKE